MPILSTQTVLVSVAVLFGLAAGSHFPGHLEGESASAADKAIVTIGNEVLTRAQVENILRLLPPRERSLFFATRGKAGVCQLHRPFQAVQPGSKKTGVGCSHRKSKRTHSPVPGQAGKKTC